MRRKTGKLAKELVSLFIIVSVLLSLCVAPVSAVNYGKKKSGSATTTSEKTREISVVYDDSGSMFYSNDISHPADRWANAAYAMQVFTAMLGENDTLNIYQLSDDGEHITTLKGSDKAQSNVNTVNGLNGSNGTPFAPVEKAAEALEKSEADEKWLVVLTDGYFDGVVADANGAPVQLLDYVGVNNIKVVYMGMDEDCCDMSGYAREMFYPYMATSDTILDRMTEIASLVYNYKPIPITDNGNGTFTVNADIPISKLIVFAQGDGSSVSDVQVNGASLSGMTDSSVDVRVNQQTGFYADADPGSLTGGLDGTIYTAEAKDEDKPFSDGTYTFSCNVSNVEVFAEPGVTVDAVLTNDYGESFHLEDKGTTDIPEGDWKVSVQILNPLTGAVIDPSASTLLGGAATSVVVTDDAGNVNEYSDGDTVTLSGGSIEIYGRATYQGATETIEKTSPIHKLNVSRNQLSISFDNPAGYELDALTLLPDQDLTFHVTIQGKPLTADQAEAVKFDKVEDTNGIAWEVEAVDDAGNYKLVPSYAKRKGLAAVDVGEADLTISASLKDEGDKREGTATVPVNIQVSDACLQLALTMPDATIQNKKQTASYMFDCQLRGTPTGESGDTERPYILVEVQVQNPDGSLRQLTDEEWADGVENFSFEAHEQYPNFLWRLANMCVGIQTLNFTAVQGDAASTYKLYLDGPTATNVLPNTSDLTVTLTYKYDNGAKLSGSSNGVVSVKPLPLWRYLIWFLVILLVVLLLIAWIIKMATKPRFPRGFKPWAYTTCVLGGSPMPVPAPSHALKFRKSKRWSLTEPEHCKVNVSDSNSTNVTMTLHLVALDRAGAFKLESLSPFAMYAGGTVLDGTAYNQLVGHSTEQAALTHDVFQSNFTITNRIAGKTYVVTITFNGNPEG